MLRNVLRTWIPLAAAIVVVIGVEYVISQQMLRLGADDLPLQLALDAASALADGSEPAAVLPPGPVEISSSLAPFGLVFDAQGILLASSGVLHGAAPTLPDGVREFARENGQDRVTWQPESGVRIAAVVVPYSGASEGTLVMGRSLKEVERRIDLVGQLALAGMGAGAAGLFFVVWASEWAFRRAAG
jgi:hypothetical protein